MTTARGEDRLPKAKPFEIPKRLIWESWKRVAANRGAPGVDKESIKGFENRLGDNLYTLWNRMSSGSYLPDPVRQVLIPKGDGQSRALGIPTVTDRVAQMAVKEVLEPRLESLFHSSSYGYRPGRSAKQAVAAARQRCWRYDWVVDLDIRAFFDSIDHDLMMRAVEKHVPEKWIRLYIKRWLTCSVELADGTLESRNCGTPQGGVISPLLANLYLHYAFDAWMQRHHVDVPFERYADDVVCHCRSREEAEQLLEALRGRLVACRLAVHPEKTRLVYCKDGKRRGSYVNTRFDFLGFSFHARTVQDKQGKLFTGFGPAVSRKALKRMSEAIRSLDLNSRMHWELSDIARQINPMIRGWINYYGAFYPQTLRRFLVRLELWLGKWARKKYTRLRRRRRRSWQWLKRCREASPRLFVHWEYLFLEGAG